MAIWAIYMNANAEGYTDELFWCLMIRSLARDIQHKSAGVGQAENLLNQVMISTMLVSLYFVSSFAVISHLLVVLFSGQGWDRDSWVQGIFAEQALSLDDGQRGEEGKAVGVISHRKLSCSYYRSLLSLCRCRFRVLHKVSAAIAFQANARVPCSNLGHLYRGC